MSFPSYFLEKNPQAKRENFLSLWLSPPRPQLPFPFSLSEFPAKDLTLYGPAEVQGGSDRGWRFEKG